ncbi:cytochrome P450 4c3-like isoform X2 [Leguminivora glycinivorella]|uniref:cytochrome P450 4c3-like isoform X2 n=1 Tax=Leguminivora glycinivorella TaxID=1035111 RepID=UPI00200BE4CA|nr:cytochrome P450 4c3-like isoform X2 [Leguminivora glycinivorella]
MLVVWLFLVLPLLWLVAFRYRRRRMYALASKITGGKEELPFIGITHKFTGTTEDIMSSLKELSYTAMENDGMIRGWLGHILYFLALDPVDLEVVLKTCLEKDDLHRFLRKIIGYGAIFAPVSIWRPRRKILVPAFSPKIVDSFVPVFAEQKTAFGVNINAQDDEKSPFLVELNNILQLACERIFHLWLQPDWLYKFFPQYRRHKQSLRILHGFTNDVIMKKRDELKAAQRLEAKHEFDLSDYSNKTFLDLLIHFSGGEKGYSNMELREEILTLTIAATDTSATAVGYTLKMMAKYPHIQEKVLEELDDVFGDSDRLFEKEDLLRLKYLERVIKETLRLFPPVPFIIRKVDEEITLPSGRVLPAGSGVVVSIWGTHRNPKYWGPDAEKFDPDRFLLERFNLKHPCAFIPFSSGPRNCIGYQYALMSIKTALSSILRYNRVVGDTEACATPQIRVKLDVMMKAVDGYEVALERRRLPKCKA